MDFETRMVEKFKVRPIIYFIRKKEVKKEKGEISISSQSEINIRKNKCNDFMSNKKFSRNQLKGEKDICRFYSRPWTPIKSVYENLYADDSFKWPTRRMEYVEKPLPCRKLPKRKKSKRRICRPNKKSFSQPCVYDLLERSQCVLCFENLYKKGHICDLFKKVPLIKKQSEVNGDNVAMALGERSRIVVHKKCYDVYTDPLSTRWELYSDRTAEIIKNITMSNVVSSSQQKDEDTVDSACGMEKEIEVKKNCTK